MSTCEGRVEELINSFSNKNPEEVVYQILNLPFSQITKANIFNSSRPSAKGPIINVDQREAINTLISQDVNAIDDFDSPIIQHASVFKIFLDKVKHSRSFEHDRSSYKHERNVEMDNVIAQINEVSKDQAETILELEQDLIQNSENLKNKVLGFDVRLKRRYGL